MYAAPDTEEGGPADEPGSVPRISASHALPLTEPVRVPSAFTRFFTSRAAIVTLLPGLVAAISALFLFVGLDTLRRESLASARSRLQELTEARAWALRGALEQSTPVLTELRRLVLSEDTRLAYQGPRLVSLLRGRPGMAYVSVSFPDGMFRGAYLDADESLRFQESVVREGGGEARHYALVGDEEPRFVETLPTDYDPRTRGFYKLAQQAKRAVWTVPYAFYDTRVTGVTRTEAVFGPEGGLRAVLTVDFDVAALSRFLTDEGLAGASVVLFTRAGELLAYPAGAVGEESAARREGRPIGIDDLRDPVLRAFFGAGRGTRPASSFTLDGERFMAALADASEDPALGWTVGYVAPERLFLAATERYQREGLWSFATVVVLALSVSVAFAYAVTRTERRAQDAEARAQRLGSRARELGSYRLVARLGRGGMGEVWRAEHRLLAREAAIKLIRPEENGFDAPQRKLRFRREATALSQLRSRNTIEIIDYGVAVDGTFFYVMELLDGLDFEALITRSGAVSPGRLVNLLVQVCASLAEAHDRGLVHRDVKPANLFLCRAADELDIVKVLDFGLVRSVRTGPSIPPPLSASAELTSAITPLPLRGHAITGMQGILGTPGFMAPEQVLGRELDGRADLYALGCVAFWLITGKLLFDDADFARRSAACLADVPNLRARLGPDVPDALASVIARCLSKKRSGRPRDARALAEELRRAAETFTPDQRFDAEKARAWWDGASFEPTRVADVPPETLVLPWHSSHSVPEGAG